MSNQIACHRVVVKMLEQLTYYKEKLFSKFCGSNKIVELLQQSNETGVELRYKNIFPYPHTIGTTQEASAFLCFDIEARAVHIGTYKDVVIKVWVFCHESIMRTKDGLRTDLLANEVGKLMDKQDVFTSWKVEWVSCNTFSPCNDYHGRQLVFKVTDFRNS